MKYQKNQLTTIIKKTILFVVMGIVQGYQNKSRADHLLNEVLLPCSQIVDSPMITSSINITSSVYGYIALGICVDHTHFYVVNVHTSPGCYAKIGIKRQDFGGVRENLYDFEFVQKEDFHPDYVISIFENILREREPELFMNSCHLK